MDALVPVGILGMVVCVTLFLILRHLKVLDASGRVVEASRLG